jgi:hypothetical protein
LSPHQLEQAEFAFRLQVDEVASAEFAVKVANEDVRSRRRAAECVGHRGDVQLEVLAGLSPGDAVVVHPGDRVRDGVKVEQMP